MDKILSLLEENARLTNAQIAAMLDLPEQQVEQAIEHYEQAGVIRGYRAVIDWDKTDRPYVAARIELKVTPKPDMGFEDIACKLAQYPEVETVYLMSGGYDIALTVEGKTFKDVAMFVAKCLAPMDTVLSTATHFVLRKYKQHGIITAEGFVDEREVATL